MSAATELREAWTFAAQKPKGVGLRVFPLGVGESDIWATMNDAGHNGLLVAVRPMESLAPAVSSASRDPSALVAEIYPFRDDGRDRRGFHVTCREPALIDAFYGFCVALIARYEAAEPIARAFDACYEEFRRLVAGRPLDILSAPLTGLLGELIVLSELVSKDPAAYALWSYPATERHDFRNNLTSLEVKTTLRADRANSTVAITSIDQLEPPPLGSLYLHWIRLERDPGGPIAFERLLQAIGACVGSSISHEIRHRSERAGNMAGAASLAFAVQQRRTFRITGDFPRLTPSRLIAGATDAGIGVVRYELDLSSAGAFEVTADEAMRALTAGDARP